MAPAALHLQLQKRLKEGGAWFITTRVVGVRQRLRRSHQSVAPAALYFQLQKRVKGGGITLLLEHTGNMVWLHHQGKVSTICPSIPTLSSSPGPCPALLLAWTLPR